MVRSAKIKKPRPTESKSQNKPPTVADLVSSSAQSGTGAFKTSLRYIIGFFRSFMGSILGVLAINLALVGIFVGWAQTTFIDTARFASVVVPIVDQPETQRFLINQTTDLVIQGIRGEELRGLLVTGQNEALPISEQNKLVRERTRASIEKVVKSDQFAELWKSEAIRAHRDLTSELSGDSADGEVDLSKLVNGLISQLSGTDLAPVVQALDIPAEAGKIKLSASSLANLQRAYNYSFSSAGFVLTASLALAATALGLSVNRLMALRHLTAVLAIASGSLALLLAFPVRLGLGSENSRATQAAFQEIVRLLVRDLQIIYFRVAIGAASVAVAIFIWQGLDHRRNTKLRGVPKRLKVKNKNRR